MRKIVLFGNGLGRSLDPEYFDLASALAYAWNAGGLLSDEQKSLIWRCLPDTVLEEDGGSFPRSEDELDTLQTVLSACDLISRLETDDQEGWLTGQGREFPNAIRRYLHASASYFHDSPHNLSSDFIMPLQDWILETRSHIATLNYDELLYRAFIGSEVFCGYRCLLDGFVPSFDPEHMERFNPARQAFYLHLHGSPLYFTSSDGVSRKSALGDLPFLEGYSSSHLVLTHVRHKMSVISSSPILSEYWRRLEEAMKEVNSIVLFGYGGGDAHLNLLISRYFREKNVEIIERNKPEYAEGNGGLVRCAWWAQKLAVPITCLSVSWHESILDYSAWGN